MSQNVINVAEAATDRVAGHVEAVLAELNTHFQGRVVNGDGVYVRPSECTAALGRAIESLGKAKAIMDGTRWPTDADYDAAEGHSI